MVYGVWKDYRIGMEYLGGAQRWRTLVRRHFSPLSFYVSAVACGIGTLFFLCPLPADVMWDVCILRSHDCFIEKLIHDGNFWI